MDIIALLFTPLIYTNLIKYCLSIYQQQYYKTNRFIQCLIKNIDKKKLFNKCIITFGYIIVSICFIYFFKVPTYLIFLYTIITLMLLDTQKDYIVPLKYTHRIKRSFITIYTLLYISLFSLYFLLDKSNIFFLFYNVLLIHFISIVTIISMLCLLPIEKKIREKYALKAKMSLLESKKLKTIGITGSYGKTSTKNILTTILSSSYDVLATPKSYNTPMGISNCINNEKVYLYDYFIAEMGIDEVKGMDRLLSIISPCYAIITSIGPMHLKTFKSIDRIINEKMKLACSIDKDGVVIINNDNEYLREYDKSKIKAKVVTVGIDNPSDVMATNIICDENGSTFDVIYKDHSFPISLPLPAKINILNTLSAIALALEVYVSEEKIISSLSSIKPIAHRLVLNKRNNHTIIEDSYNSNIEGFSNALDVLSKYSEKKIVITPGLIELGKYNKEYNTRIAKTIVSSCNEIVLIKNKSSMYIKEEIKRLSPTFSIIEVDNFYDANRYISKMYTNENIVVLIENDLPDNYLN